MADSEDIPKEANYPDKDLIDRMMGFVLDHYLKHHKIVLKKLQHARSATHKSIQDIDILCDANVGIDRDLKEFQEIREYDKVWNDIIETFRNNGMSEEELDAIEKILITIPQAIKRYYDILVQQDAVLLALITEIQGEEYIKAIEFTQKLQKKPNPMSGLTSSYYDSAVNDSLQEVVIYSKTPRK